MLTASTLDEVKKFRQEMYDKSMALVDRKGADYNRDQQNGGDTLFNIKVCELLGVVPTAERGILVRLMDKMMRLNSLVHPDREPANTDESVMDTVADIHNYVDFMALLHHKRKLAAQEAADVAEGIDTPDAVEPDAPKTDCPAPLTFGKLFADPDDVGQSEYRAIYETVVDGVFDGDAPERDYVMSHDELEQIAGMVDEFRLVATEHLSQLTKAIAHELERTAGTQK